MQKLKDNKKQKVKYCTWDDLKHDKEQLAIYKEIAEINLYTYKRMYEAASKN